MKVMVVEDEQASRKLVCFVLTAEGHNVLSVSSAEMALESIRANKPEIVLVDLALPGMDGLEFARLLKKDDATRHVAIVAITAYPEQCTKEASLKTYCEAFIVKPVDTRMLAEQLAGALLVDHPTAGARPEVA
jgi:CheY-like chemotaxis protein